jgi:hypothetical protein
LRKMGDKLWKAIDFVFWWLFKIVIWRPII